MRSQHGGNLIMVDRLVEIHQVENGYVLRQLWYGGKTTIQPDFKSVLKELSIIFDVEAKTQ
jgi:hypothetical protein